MLESRGGKVVLQVCISVLYGESTNVANNRLLGRFSISGIQSAAAGVPQVEINCSLDSALRLTVVARDLDSGRQKVWQQGSNTGYGQACC